MGSLDIRKSSSGVSNAPPQPEGDTIDFQILLWKPENDVVKWAFSMYLRSVSKWKIWEIYLDSGTGRYRIYSMEVDSLDSNRRDNFAWVGSVPQTFYDDVKAAINPIPPPPVVGKRELEYKSYVVAILDTLMQNSLLTREAADTALLAATDISNRLQR